MIIFDGEINLDNSYRFVEDLENFASKNEEGSELVIYFSTIGGEICYITVIVDAIYKYSQKYQTIIKLFDTCSSAGTWVLLNIIDHMPHVQIFITNLFSHAVFHVARRFVSTASKEQNNDINTLDAMNEYFIKRLRKHKFKSEYIKKYKNKEDVYLYTEDLIALFPQIEKIYY